MAPTVSAPRVWFAERPVLPFMVKSPPVNWSGVAASKLVSVVFAKSSTIPPPLMMVLPV